MCGRFTNRYTWSELHALYGLTDSSAPASNFQPRYNIAPTDTVPVVRRKDGKRGLSLLKWGLVPFSAKTPDEGAKLINARAETVAEKAPFRSPFLHRRCLVPANGFYEWKKISPKEKQPFFITAKDNLPFAFAAIYDWWIPREGPRLESFSIITCPANSLVASVHDRMPVMLTADAWPGWLGEQLVSTDRLKALLKPFPVERMECWPVDKRVGNVKNDDAGLVEPVRESRLF